MKLPESTYARMPAHFQALFRKLPNPGREEVIAAFPQTQSGEFLPHHRAAGTSQIGTFDIRDRTGETHPTYGDSGSAARFFKTCQFTEEDARWNQKRASDAESCLSLPSEAVASALTHAAEASTLPLGLISTVCQVRSMNVTESELRIVCANVTNLIQSFAHEFSRGLGPESIARTNGPVRLAAIQKPTGTMTITASLLKLDGFAELATFSITLPNSEAGAKACVNRLFYSSKADAGDRLGSKHPTVKPVDLMRWLTRLVTPPHGVVLDPFAGTGTTGMACMAEGFDCILIEREAQYIADIKNRIAHVSGENGPLFAGLGT